MSGADPLAHVGPDLSGLDFAYEEEIVRNPYSLTTWWKYLESKAEAPARWETMLQIL
jgi:hypothetical protein